jgi:serine/threonine-protein kinase RsbW/stage II sporulation protein AB (anti-sigma F factor)
MRFERRQPAVAATVPQMRSAITPWVEELGLHEEQVQAVRLCVTEAVTNAVVHGFVEREPGSVSVVAEPGQDCLVVRVIDDGQGLGPRHDSPGLGMGLPLIGRFTNNVDLRVAPDGTGCEVRMTFAAPGLVGAPAGSDDDLRDVLDTLAQMRSREGFGGRDIGALADLLVPRIADVCTITLLDADEMVHRISGRAAHPDGSPDEEGSAFVLGFPPTSPAAPSYLAVVTGTTQVAEVTEAWCDRVAVDGASAARLLGMGLSWWAAVPLRVGDQTVGSVAIGLRESRGAPEPIVAAVERAAAQASGLVAGARLVDELRRARQRLERILGAMSDAVVVSDAEGWVVYANAAAAEIFGVDDVEALHDAEPGELIGAFEMSDADGHRIEPADMPHRRLLAGQTAEPMILRGQDRRSGEVRRVRVTSTRLDQNGDEVLIVSVIQDVADEDL